MRHLYSLGVKFKIYQKFLMAEKIPSKNALFFSVVVQSRQLLSPTRLLLHVPPLNFAAADESPLVRLLRRSSYPSQI